MYLNYKTKNIHRPVVVLKKWEFCSLLNVLKWLPFRYLFFCLKALCFAAEEFAFLFITAKFLL